MLPKKARLTAKEFEEVIKNGRVLHSSLFILRYKALESSGPSQVSAVGPVKIGKTAVLRNAIRRKIYAALQPFFSEIKPGFNIIVIAKSDVSESKLEALTSNLFDIFAKAGLLK